MRVSTVMTTGVACVWADDNVQHAASLMRGAGVGSLAVYEGDRLAGIVTEHDLVAVVADGADAAALPVRAVMSTGLFVAEPDEQSQEVAARMVEHGIRHLPVVEGGRLVGMVSARDLLILEALGPRPQQVRSL